ncbi:membrane-associating domain-containing protein [Purpureocillium lavendulum]|uniref:Membrane-associating domain-containing protein n=1 Tax=Purpureocillium lavendulum TaxID=1247861 RepID=A0AB34G1X8_9HYPO|nr:membrane-associating domain-containing protein [Purpureocillium lavendulum]
MGHGSLKGDALEETGANDDMTDQLNALHIGTEALDTSDSIRHISSTLESPNYRSSRASISGPRLSEESVMAEEGEALDTAALERALQRRRILDELISTEEGYIGDVRFLGNVYVTILASLPTLCMGLRASINQNLTEIIELHEEILGDLHRVMSRFFIYKEYGAKYEMMIKDVSSANHTMPQWDSYQKGLEVLASILSSAESAKEKSKKALTIGDLLVKPIQRVCKYPLLFAELLKHTPVSDCPNSHMELDSVLTRLREATAEINRATNDGTMRLTLEKTWLLQDRLVFPNKKLDAASKARVRSFGHIRLCGVLHVCWQATTGVIAGKADQIYISQACIDLTRARIEDADNGRAIMTRGEATQSKVHYKGNLDDFVVFVDDPETFKKWLGDKSVPLAQFVSSFKIFLTHKQGAQGTLDAAPKGILTSEFGTDNEDEVIKKILTEGTMQTVEMPSRQGVTNESMSSMKAH